MAKQKLFQYCNRYDGESSTTYVSLEYCEFDSIEEREVKNPFDIDLVGCTYILFQYDYGKYGKEYNVRVNPFMGDDKRKRFYRSALEQGKNILGTTISEEEFMEKIKELIEKIKQDPTIVPEECADDDCLKKLVLIEGIEIEDIEV